MTRIRDLSTFNAVRSAGLAKLQPSRPRIAVGMGTCGSGNGAEGVYAALRRRHRPARLGRAPRADRLLRLLRRGAAGQCLDSRASRSSSCIASRPITSMQILDALAAKTVPERLALCKIEEWDHITAQMHLRRRLSENSDVERGSVLPRPKEDRPAQLRTDQPRRHRGIYRDRRLPVPVQGADRRHARSW